MHTVVNQMEGTASKEEVLCCRKYQVDGNQRNMELRQNAQPSADLLISVRMWLHILPKIAFRRDVFRSQQKYVKTQKRCCTFHLFDFAL